MQLKLHPWLRAAIAFVLFGLFFLTMVEWEGLNPIILFSKFVAYIVSALWGMLTGAVCYAVLPTKKVVEASLSNLRSNGKKDRVLGYWTWLFCFVVIYCGALALYLSDL